MCQFVSWLWAPTCLGPALDLLKGSSRNVVLLSFNQNLLINFDIYRNDNSWGGDGGSCEVKEFLDCLNLEDGTDRLSRNVGTEEPFNAA